MGKGKFEAGKGAGRSSSRSASHMGRGAMLSKLWPILAAVAGVLVLVVGILIVTKQKNRNLGATDTPIATVDLSGMPRNALERRFSELDRMVRQTLTLTLTPESEDEEKTEEPIVLEFSDEISNVHLDLVKLTADLNEGRGREAENVDSYVLDPRDYLVYDEEGLRRKIDAFVSENESEYSEATFSLEAVEATAAAPAEEENQDDENEEPVPEKLLKIQLGSAGREFDADAIYDAVTECYALALIAEDPESVMQTSVPYKLRLPDSVEIEDLWERFCKDAVEPEVDTETGEVKDGENGYGFDREQLQKMLDAAQPGQELQVVLYAIKPENDAESIRELLFKDVLAEAHTPHSSVYNRTNNLKLACEAIDGTIVMPGEEFSFNKTVGERTADKGYKEAIVYASGGVSKPELGGGVCQVASSIYYAVLQADLKTTQRAAHMYLVDYVPYGMDATIYWGSLDYKFENTSAYPIKISASVSDGKVHIILYGTEWKDYTVELSYKILSKEAWNTVEKEVPNDGTYRDGEVITTPYTGYTVETYKTTKNKTTGAEQTTKIATSEYKKRDKVIAKIVAGTTEPKPTDPQPTEPKPTEPKPTEPKPTEPKPTEPKPTEPKPTDPAPTEPKPTDPQPTDPAPTEPQPTDPTPSLPDPSEGNA